MKPAMAVSFLFLFVSLFYSSCYAADVVVVPLGGRQTRINADDLVQVETTFGGEGSGGRKFERRLPDGTYLTDWQVPAGKKLVITDLSITPYTFTTDANKLYFQFGGQTMALEQRYIQTFMVTSGQTYNFSFGAGVLVNSNNYVYLFPLPGAIGAGMAFAYGYLIDE